MAYTTCSDFCLISMLMSAVLFRISQFFVLFSKSLMFFARYLLYCHFSYQLSWNESGLTQFRFKFLPVRLCILRLSCWLFLYGIDYRDVIFFVWHLSHGKSLLWCRFSGRRLPNSFRSTKSRVRVYWFIELFSQDDLYNTQFAHLTFSWIWKCGLFSLKNEFGLIHWLKRCLLLAPCVVR